MSAASSAHLAKPSSSLSSPSPCPSSSPSRSPIPVPPLPPRHPPARAVFAVASPPSAFPSSSTDFDHHQNLKHQQQIQSSFRRATQLIGPPKGQRESADPKMEREKNTETEQEQGAKTREKMPFLASLPAAVPRSSSSSSSSPLSAPMDPLSQLVASFAAAAHHNQQQQRNASLPCVPTAPPAPSFLPNGAQLRPAGPFLSSAHLAPADFNALLAIAPPGVLGPFIAGGIANTAFVPPPPEVLFAASQHSHNHHQQSVNGTTSANNGIPSNGTAVMPPGIAPGFPFPLDPVVLSTFQPYMVPPEARRKNATREVTAPLKHWLNGHRKNPYPTKAEKTFLAVLTKMSMTQVSTWFANARRRLKKENKMTWSPRNRPNDEDDFFEPDEGAEGTRASANGGEGPSSPELEEEQKGEGEEQNGGQNQRNPNGAMEQQRKRRGIWSIADTLGEDGHGQGQNAKLKQESSGREDGGKDSSNSRTEWQQSYEEESDGEKTKVKKETKPEQQHEQQHKCEPFLHEQQQRTESPRSGQSGHCAALPRSPHPPPPGPHSAPCPLDLLIGSPPMPSAHPMLLHLPPADLPNARHNLLFALQHQNQLHHQRSLMAAANPMMTAMFLAQHFAAQQQMGGVAEGGKQAEAVVEHTAAAQQWNGLGDQPQEERHSGATSLLPPLPSHPAPFVHLRHLSSVSPTSSALVGQKRAAIPLAPEASDNGIPLPKRQCRAET